MNPQIKALQDNLQALRNEAVTLSAVASMDAEQFERCKALTTEIETCKANLAALVDLEGSTSAADEFLNGATGGILQSISSDLSGGQAEALAQIDPVAKFKAMKGLHAIGTHPFISSVIHDRSAARDTALAMGHVVAASIIGSKRSQKWCDAKGLNWQGASGQSESINEDGGFLVPEEFEAALIVLREAFGIFRQHAQIVPMGRETKWQPRRTQGISASFVGEGGTISGSKIKVDRVNLVAKKMAALAYDSTEIDEDSLIAMGDLLIGEFAYGFAKKEDEVGFTGTGISTDGGITGLAQKQLDQWSTAPSAGEGLILAAGNLFSEVTMANFHDMQGNLPEYADMNAKWFCHKRFWSVVLMRLAIASGGVPAAEIMMGGRKMFLGDPVIVSQAMPRTDSNGQVACHYGDLAKTAMLGDRRGITIAESIHHKFDTDEIAFRATQRMDINVHSVLTPTTSATELPGPMVGLVMASS